MSRKKLAGIIVGCIVVVIVIVVIATRPPKPTYTLSVSVNPPEAGSVSPSGGEYESGDQVTLTASPASGYTIDYWSGNASGITSSITIIMNSNKSVTAHFETIPIGPEESEPAIPTHFTTYTDELGVFSISYPPEWELHLEYMEEVRQRTQDIMRSIISDFTFDEGSFVFMAGLPIETGWFPNVNITVAPLPATMPTHDEWVTPAIEGLKEVFPDYHEFSRVKTTIDNRTATITEWQATIAELGTYRYVQMNILASKTSWVVTCTTLPDDYSEWEDDFDAIVRSLRILK